MPKTCIPIWLEIPTRKSADTGLEKEWNGKAWRKVPVGKFLTRIMSPFSEAGKYVDRYKLDKLPSTKAAPILQLLPGDTEKEKVAHLEAIRTLCIKNKGTSGIIDRSTFLRDTKWAEQNFAGFWEYIFSPERTGYARTAKWFMECHIFPYPVNGKLGIAAVCPSAYHAAITELMFILILGLKRVRFCPQCWGVYGERRCPKCESTPTRSELDKFHGRLRNHKSTGKIDGYREKYFHDLAIDDLARAEDEYDSLMFKEGKLNEKMSRGKRKREKLS